MATNDNSKILMQNIIDHHKIIKLLFRIERTSHQHPTYDQHAIDYNTEHLPMR